MILFELKSYRIVDLLLLLQFCCMSIHAKASTRCSFLGCFHLEYLVYTTYISGFMQIYHSILTFCLNYSAVILPYYKDGRKGEGSGNSNREIVFRRHIVDRMPIDGWNDIWSKLHQQLINVDVINVDSVPAEIYSTIATAVIWSMRLALSISIYLWVDSVARPIYSKLIPCDLGKPAPKVRQPLKRRALGSLGKSR